MRYTERLEKKMRGDKEKEKEKEEAKKEQGHYTPGRKSFIVFVVYFAFTLACIQGLLHVTIWN